MKYLFALLFLFTAQAEEIKFDNLTVKSGKVYNKVVVTDSNPAEISIRHENGTARIPLENLPEDAAKLFPYDAELAKKHREMDAVLQAQIQRALTKEISRKEIVDSISKQMDRDKVSQKEKAERLRLLHKKLDTLKLERSKGLR